MWTWVQICSSLPNSLSSWPVGRCLCRSHSYRVLAGTDRVLTRSPVPQPHPSEPEAHHLPWESSAGFHKPCHPGTWFQFLEVGQCCLAPLSGLPKTNQTHTRPVGPSSPETSQRTGLHGIWVGPELSRSVLLHSLRLTLPPAPRDLAFTGP